MLRDLSKRAEEEELGHDRVDELVVQPQLLLPTLSVNIVPWLVVPLYKVKRRRLGVRSQLIAASSSCLTARRFEVLADREPPPTPPHNLPHITS